MLARKYDEYAWEVEEQQENTVRSECLISKSNELVALKQQEAALMLENSEERIVVEQLKGPERITSIAEKQLGMQVARNNIYVKADKGKIAYDGYAYAK